MNAVLLCPGPSLARLESLPPCDISIAVNRAAIAHPCDWWAALDLPLIQNIGPQVRQGHKLFTCRNTAESLVRHGSEWAGAIGRVAEDLACPVQSWSLYTATAALALADSLGAERIDVYGSDMAGEDDWDGPVMIAGINRTTLRWEREARIWRGVCEWLTGIEIVRHGIH